MNLSFGHDGRRHQCKKIGLAKSFGDVTGFILTATCGAKIEVEEIVLGDHIFPACQDCHMTVLVAGAKR